MNQRNFRRVLQKYMDGNCTEVERKIVDDWLNQLSAHGNDTIQNPMEAKEKFLRHIEDVVKKNKATPFRYRQLAVACGIAAILLATFGIIRPFFLKEQFLHKSLANESIESAVINNSNVSQTTHFPDGTDVTLYPNSKLTHVSFTEGERRMRLEGKAFFKVAPNPKRPFIIVTEKLITKVLGTSFTIHAEKGKAESVEVKTGKVAVYKSAAGDLHNLPNSFVAITPNHQVYLDAANEKLITSIVEHPVIIPSLEQHMNEKETDAAQTENYDMKFEETSVIEILKALEKAYGVKIACDKKTSDCIITANLKEEDLFMRLQVVCDLIGGSYQVNGNVVIVKSQGCK